MRAIPSVWQRDFKHCFFMLAARIALLPTSGSFQVLLQSVPATSATATRPAVQALAIAAGLEVPPKRRRLPKPRFPAAQRPFGAPHQPQDTRSALLRLVGSVEGLDVLVIGCGALEIMCGLDGQGARSVTAACAGQRLPMEPIDLAIVPQAASLELADPAIAQARLAMRPSGRLMLCLTPGAAGPLVRQIEARLLDDGFVVGRRQLHGQVVLTAKLPPCRVACAGRQS